MILLLYVCPQLPASASPLAARLSGAPIRRSKFLDFCNAFDASPSLVRFVSKFAHMAPIDRLTAINSQLAAESVLATRFRPKLSSDLPVSFTPLNPITFLLKAASIRPNHIAISHPETGRSWTYEEWAMRVCSLSYALKSRGLKRGDKV